MEKKNLFKRVSVLMGLLCIGLTVSGCSLFNSQSTSSKILSVKGIGNETVSVEIFLEDLTPVRTFLANGAVTELGFDHLTGEFVGGSEIREPFSTEVTWGNLCDDVTVDSIALVVQAPQGVSLGDISLNTSSQSGTVTGVQIEEITGSLMAASGQAFEAETGQKLFLVSVERDLFDNSGWMNVNLRLRNIAYTNNEFHIKGIIAAKVICDAQTLYAPVIPATYKFADVPAIIVEKNNAELDIPTGETLPAPNNELTYITDTNYAGGVVVDDDDDGETPDGDDDDGETPDDNDDDGETPDDNDDDGETPDDNDDDGETPDDNDDDGETPDDNDDDGETPDDNDDDGETPDDNDDDDANPDAQSGNSSGGGGCFISILK